MFHYQFHIRDYLTKTRHLTLIEDLAYRRLLDTYYTEEAPLPEDANRCARLIAMTEHVDAVALVLNEFFTLTDEGWRNERADAEIAAYHARANIARANGLKGGRKPKTQSVPESVPSGVPTANPEETQGKANRKPKTNTPHTPHEGFDRFWSAYPKKTAKAEAIKAFAKVAPDSELLDKMLEAIEAAKGTKDWMKDGGQFIPFPSTWLNQRRWEDHLEAETTEENWL